MAIQQSETAEKTGVRETLIETNYVGTHSKLVGTAGEAYRHKVDGYWAYRPFGGKNFYKIKNPTDLDCNMEKSWIRCNYIGINPTIQGTTGKATFNEQSNAWEYKPDGKNDLYRIVKETSFEFIRDKDVNLTKGED